MILWVVAHAFAAFSRSGRYFASYSIRLRSITSRDPITASVCRHRTWPREAAHRSELRVAASISDGFGRMQHPSTCSYFKQCQQSEMALDGWSVWVLIVFVVASGSSRRLFSAEVEGWQSS
jgi:hypothetical protein